MLEKKFQPRTIEDKWYKVWEKQNYFKVTKTSKDNYCIVIPPPNVTGSLHMGHAFQDTLMDTLIRYHRMQGYNTLWQVGTDHAGIATQMVVERQLNKNSLSRHDIGREQFIEKIWKWKAESGSTITKQLRRLGSSIDWSRERFTMDVGLSKAVQKSFIQLYEEGLIYRKQSLVNWDPQLQTAISDIEVVSVEENGSLWYIHYPVIDTEETLVVATTRPETMLGDVAVAVNPDDIRYKKFIGKQVQLPLTDRIIPIISDSYVDPEFGTGCVKITPGHDFNDYAIGKRHKLPLINVLTYDAKINNNSPVEYQGLDRFVARTKIIADLKNQNLIEKIESHILKVPRGDRTNAIIEPYLTKQWFIKIKPLAEPAIEIVKSGKIKFVPANWDKTYFEWMNNIEDWCISRQIWWGHRIPAWYDENGNVYVAKSADEVRQKYNISKDIIIKQDEDVLDTWFSSALWPLSALGWPEKTKELASFYPTNVLVTGFDIIFFWVARMIMFGLKFSDKIPFEKVYIHGLIQDQHGQKMSKSKGNIIDPLDLIDGISLEDLLVKRTTNLMQPDMVKKIISNTKKEFPNGIAAFGVDALRFTFCALATNGRHIKFEFNRLEAYRNFCNKLWNAARYVLINCENKDCGFNNKSYKIKVVDKWIISKLQLLIAEVHKQFAQYRFDLAAQALYEFVWNEYCDWYLELTKPIFNSEDSSLEAKVATRNTLLTVLDNILRLIHPIMPFISEEIWQMLKEFTGTSIPSVMIAEYPNVNKSYIDKNSIDIVQQLKEIIMALRNIRGEMNISPKISMPLIIANCDNTAKAMLEENKSYLLKLANLSAISYLSSNTKVPLAATAMANNLELLVPIADLIDKQAERVRLKKILNNLKKDIIKSEGKLSNDNYIRKAPKEIVQAEQELLDNIKKKYTKLSDYLEKIDAL